MIGAIRIFLVVAAMVALSLSLIPVQYLLLKLKNNWKRRLPTLFHRIAARLFGFRIKTVGQIHEGRPLLLVANHFVERYYCSVDGRSGLLHRQVGSQEVACFRYVRRFAAHRFRGAGTAGQNG